MMMSYADFMKAVTPYVYNGLYDDKIEKFLKENPEKMQYFFDQFDADGNGLISYTEFFYLIVFLTARPPAIRKAFRKTEPHNSCTQDELYWVFRSIRKKTQAGRKQHDRVKLDPRAVSASDEEYSQTNKWLVNEIFRGKDRITLDEFLDKQTKMRRCLLQFEWAMIGPDEKNSISYEQFLRTMMLYIKPTKHDRFLRRAAKIAP